MLNIANHSDIFKFTKNLSEKSDEEFGSIKVISTH